MFVFVFSPFSTVFTKTFRGVLKHGIVWYWFNFLPKEKFLDWSKLKAFANDKIYVITGILF